MKSISNPRPSLAKATPLRTCVSCRQVKDKREMMRLIRTTDRVIEIDIRHRRDGRGAYLCRDTKCWEAGLKGDRLERALRTSLTSENREQLLKQAQELLEGAS
ncbi:MAG: YlxR family protein [Chloroflexota bacterium]